MHIAEFCREIEKLGFVNDATGVQVVDEFVRSYFRPERLASVIKWANVGKAGDTYSVTFQASPQLVETHPKLVHFSYAEIKGENCRIAEIGSSHTPLVLDANEELLSALRLDVSDFLAWLCHTPIAFATMEGDEEKTNVVISTGAKFISIPNRKEVN